MAATTICSPARCDRPRHPAADCSRRRRRQQGVRGGAAAQGRPVTRHRGHQRRNGQPAAPWRDQHAQSVLRTRRPDVDDGIAVSDHPRAVHACACRPSPGRGSTTTTTSTATRIRGTVSRSRTTSRSPKEVFGPEPGGYTANDEFWTAYSIPALIDSEVKAAAQPASRAPATDSEHLPRAVGPVSGVKGRQ